MRGTATTTITARLADAFYTEALLLADETRSYLDGRGEAERDLLGPQERVVFACESLNASTRLMQVTTWLLARKNCAARRGDDAIGLRELPALGDVDPIDPVDMAMLPAEARRLIGAGIDLYDRVRRLGGDRVVVPMVRSPALALIQRLERSL